MGGLLMSVGEIVVSLRVNGISGCGDAVWARGNVIAGDGTAVL